MDVADLYTADAHNDGAEMMVKDMHGKDTEIYIRVAGVDSEAWRGGLRKAQRRVLESTVNGDGEEKIDAALLLANATLGWRGITANGEELPFSRDEALKLYRNAPYIADQVDRFLSSRANFTKG